VVAAGIRRAVVAIEDPHPGVRGRGLAYLRSQGVTVSVGVERGAAERLNRGFFSVMRRGRPFVTIKAALSLDGKVAAARGSRTAITSAAAHDLVHRERAEVDAIAIGSETLVVDDPVLTARVAYRQRPLTRVIFDRRLRTAPTAAMLKTLESGPVIVMTTLADGPACSRADVIRKSGASVEVIEGDGFLEQALSRLAARGVMSLIVEGGPTLHESFWRAGLVDRLQLFVSPVSFGPEGVPWFDTPQGTIAGLIERRTTPIGPDTLIEGLVNLNPEPGTPGTPGTV
jgi:diaminohydroxyphosphoribosylaminopyrimidine deaminase/5-amino-6-(5-phosphoribosylamino)uracil reductase